MFKLISYILSYIGINIKGTINDIEYTKGSEAEGWEYDETICDVIKVMFNFLFSHKGYDIDGNKILEEMKRNKDIPPFLIDTYSGIKRKYE